MEGVEILGELRRIVREGILCEGKSEGRGNKVKLVKGKCGNRGEIITG